MCEVISMPDHTRTKALRQAPVWRRDREHGREGGCWPERGLTMGIDSPNYDASLAAALVIYEELFPNPGKPDALVIGKMTFIIMQALEDFERRLSRVNREPSAN